MKKILILFMSLVLLTSIACTRQEASKTQLSYDGAMFSIDYPSDWLVQTQGPIVGFISPLDGKDDKFLENVNVIVEPLNVDVSMDDYLKKGFSDLEKMFGKLDNLQVKETTFAGSPATKISYSASKQGKTANLVQWVTKKDKTFYIITYTAFPEGYQSHLAAAEGMMSSFRIK